MHAKHFATCTLIVAATYSVSAAQSFESLSTDEATKVGKLLTQQAAKIEKPQLKVEADPDESRGFKIRRDGVVVVPQKETRSVIQSDAVNDAKGAAVGYLFMSSGFRPVIDKKRAADDAVRSMEVQTDNGQQVEVTCYILAVRHVEGSDWRLYAYGTGEKPLIDSKFSEEGGGEEGPINIAVKDVAGSEGSLVVTMFGTYTAKLQIGYEGQ